MNRHATRTATLALGLLAGLALITPHAHAHIGEPGEHLVIGYYYGHDPSDPDFETPADPPLDTPKLLVDTHPWELGNILWATQPVSGGWATTLPGFDPLPLDDEEAGGHGFYSWTDPANSADPYKDLDNPLPTPDVYLHLVSVDPGLSVLVGGNPFAGPLPLELGDEFHVHPDYFIDDPDGSLVGQTFSVTFYLTDNDGYYATSDNFTLNFIAGEVPEPGSAAVLALSGVALLMRRRR